MKRVIIIGCPGSGKSTFGRKLGSITGIPLCHLDMLYWNEDKTTVPRDIFIGKLQNVMRGDKWIIDGNYASTMEMRMKECDTVFFLDYPVEVCLDGIRERKGKPRSDMPWVEESNYDEEFLSFINDYNSKNRPEVMELIKKYPEKEAIIFRSRNEADVFLASLK